MVQVRFTMQSTLTPERILSAATDFSDRRTEIWSGIDPARYEVHAVGDGWADVTEGGRELGGIWARERYDWARPGTVTAEVQESNVFAAGSRWELQVRPAGDGGSTVDWLTERRPRGIKGRILVTMLAFGGRRYLMGYLRHTLERLQPSASGRDRTRRE
jgi:hypothetical protein